MIIRDLLTGTQGFYLFVSTLISGSFSELYSLPPSSIEFLRAHLRLCKTLFVLSVLLSSITGPEL